MAPAASAHVTLTPTRVEPGADAVVTVVVPNETATDVVRSVSVTAPRGFSVEATSSPAGFARVGQSSEWRGSLAPGSFAPFGFSGSTSDATSGDLRFQVVVRYASGQSERYEPSLEVAPPSTVDNSTRTLARAALIVALAAGVAGVAAFFLALAIWLRGADASGNDDVLQEEKPESLLASKE